MNNGRLSWPSWLTNSGHLSTTGKVRRPNTDLLTIELRSQPRPR